MHIMETRLEGPFWSVALVIGVLSIHLNNFPDNIQPQKVHGLIYFKSHQTQSLSAIVTTRSRGGHCVARHTADLPTTFNTTKKFAVPQLSWAELFSDINQKEKYKLNLLLWSAHPICVALPHWCASRTLLSDKKVKTFTASPWHGNGDFRTAQLHNIEPSTIPLSYQPCMPLSQTRFLEDRKSTWGTLSISLYVRQPHPLSPLHFRLTVSNLFSVETLSFGASMTYHCALNERV